MFFWLSKILWFIVNPFNIIMACLIAGWLMLFKKPAIGKRLIAAGLIIILVSGLNFVPRYMMRVLENRISAGIIPDKIDGIIVLAGMVDMEASRYGLIELTEQSDRIIEGVILARKHPDAKLILTGASGSLEQSEKLREADYLEKLAVSLGMVKDRLLIERKSRNTHEHANELSKPLYNLGNGRWVLVTSAFHMPRSFGCFKKNGITVIPYPVDYRTNSEDYDKFSLLSLMPQIGNMNLFSIALHEWIGLVAYRLAGHTDSLFPGMNENPLP